MKKKITVTAAVACLLLLAGWFMIGNLTVSYHNHLLKKAIANLGEKETVTLNEAVPFDWDIVYTFDPYTDKEKIEEVIGFHSSAIRETVSEGMVQLLFVKGKTVTASVCGYADNLGYDIDFDGSVAFADQTQFDVDTNTSIVRLSILPYDRETV